MREYRQLETDAVHESPNNPRRSFPEAALEELAASVRRVGVLQPILVRPNGNGFVLIAGARRLRAAKLAGNQTASAKYYGELIRVCERADRPGRPELQEARRGTE